MTASSAEIASILDRSDCLVDEATIAQAYDSMANAITEDLADKVPLVLCVMRGGLIPAGQLLARLSFPLEVDYIHATRYGMETKGAQLEWKVRPGSEVKDRHILIIDDIFDEGHTLVAIMQELTSLQAASVRTATLINKLHDRKVKGYTPDYIGADVEDRFLFGCGMDYQNFYRNLNAIYAVKPEAL
ncbi:hypoxanthine-guanine phosphoribosyltransferase [Pokkaliibacter sp. CJK22405]|uniref:hypoxanthine-guanine phosphoribosyltransferase n=1 Tax=Pokkaliibacter sp. CJK22405 TaxID=3384615 RepID=UPI0039849588